MLFSSTRDCNKYFTHLSIFFLHFIKSEIDILVQLFTQRLRCGEGMTVGYIKCRRVLANKLRCLNRMAVLSENYEAAPWLHAARDSSGIPCFARTEGENAAAPAISRTRDVNGLSLRKAARGRQQNPRRTIRIFHESTVLARSPWKPIRFPKFLGHPTTINYACVSQLSANKFE